MLIKSFLAFGAGFFTSLIMGEFLISIIIAVSGILVWFVYMLVMDSRVPKEMGNMIMLFGTLLSLGIFFGFGVSQHMHGGFMSWTPEREQRLKDLWKKGHSGSEIANILGGTTRNAVIGKAHRLKLPARTTSKRALTKTDGED